jgi:hypothetical protein
MIGFIELSQVVTTNNCNTKDYCNYSTQNSLQRLLASRCLVKNLVWLNTQLLNCLLNYLTN